jgi:hypothetical protein
MCCLVFKQGLHKEKTCAILIILFKSENIEKKQSVDVQAKPLDKDTVAMLNAPNDALASALKQQHPMGPICWGLNPIEHFVRHEPQESEF